MLIDEIFENMSKALDANSKILKSASTKDVIDNSQFDLIDTTQRDLDVSMYNVAFTQNAIVKESWDTDGMDKAILKEKNRAIEVGDITEQAHPETAIVAENLYGTGEVENQNEQHNKILTIVYRTPTGFSHNKMAQVIGEMMSVAEELEAEGDLAASGRIIAAASALMLKKKAELIVEAAGANDALTPDEVLGAEDILPDTRLVRRPETIPAKSPILDRSIVPVQKQDRTMAPLTKHEPATKMVVRDNTLPSAARPVPGGTPGTPTNMKGLPGGAIPVGQLGPHVAPETGLALKNTPGKLAPITGPSTGPKAPSHSIPSGPKALPGGVGKSQMFSSLKRYLRGKGVLLAGAVILGGLASSFFSAKESTKGPVDKLKASEDTKVSALAKDFEGMCEEIYELLENEQTMEAVERMADAEQTLNQLDSAAQDEMEQATIDELASSWQGLASKVNTAVQKQTASSNVQVKHERERIMGMQNFFKDHFGPNVTVSGVYNKELEDLLNTFITNVSRELNVAPKMFKLDTLKEVGTRQKLESIYDIWSRPHMYVEKS